MFNVDFLAQKSIYSTVALEHMFKKILGTSIYESEIQYIRTFSANVLYKIKLTESKFKVVKEQVQKLGFEVIASKVKTMLDCYQTISHQIYEALEVVNLHDLGYSIFKMFLQISSSISWLIKSFASNSAKNIRRASELKEGRSAVKIEVQEKEKEGEKSRQSFRQREIDRYMRRAIQIDEEEKDNSLLFSSECTCSLKQIEVFKKSRYAALSVNSSNLPNILEDAVEYLAKKSEYINKFIALRENYEGAQRFDQVPTSQSILENEGNNAIAIATEKFKQILNKLQGYRKKQTIISCDQQVQVTILHPEKPKKISNAEKSEKIKLKHLTDEVEKEKNINRQLQYKLQDIEKACILVNQELNKEREKSRNLNWLKKPRKIKKRQSISLKQDFNFSGQMSNSDKENANKRDDESDKEINEDEENSSQIIRISRGPLKRFYPSFIQQPLNQSRKKSQAPKTDLTHHRKVIDIQLTQPQKESQINKRALSSQLNIVQIQVVPMTTSKKIGIQHHIFSQKKEWRKLVRNGSQNNFQSLINHQTSIKNLDGPPTIISKEKIKSVMDQNIQNIRKSKSHNQKIKTSLPNHTLTLDDFKQQFVVNKESAFREFQFGDPSRLWKIQIQPNIKKVKINEDTLKQFFIHENNAKNHEFLNVDEKHRITKKINHVLVKKYTIYGRNVSQKPTENQGDTQTVLFHKIYIQIMNIKKLDRERFLSIVLFLRFPYSFVKNQVEIRQKLNQTEEELFEEAELQAYLRRIWGIHGWCKSAIMSSNCLAWCTHMQEILAFFGISLNNSITLPVEQK